jgi:predicted MFS family arabinose efflux permease
MMATFAVLPAFLLSALAVGVRAELGFGPQALGLAIAWFFVTTSIGATQLGNVVERLGLRTSLTTGAAGSAVSMLGVAAASSYRWMLMALTVGGLANAVLQPAVNAALSYRISPDHLGLAIGIKQSSIPAATLFGGLAVPTLGTTIGWRWTFAIAAGMAAAAGLSSWVFGGHGPETSGRIAGRQESRVAVPHLRSLVILTVGGMLAAASATSLGAFLVDAGVQVGIPEGAAGLLFAGSSVFGLGTRVGLGWLADRHPTRSRYGIIILLLLVGAPGYLLLASGIEAAYVIGALLAYGAGWGWPGLFHYTVISQYPGAPAAATGVIQSGVAAGAGLGPLLFGLVAGYFSYEAAWVTASALSLLGATLFWIGRSHLRRSLSAEAKSVTAPRLPARERWIPGRVRHRVKGVWTQDFTYEGGDLTLFYLEPDHVCTARTTAANAVVVVLEGEAVELRAGTLVERPARGAGVALPTGLLWTAVNYGTSDAVIVVLPSGATGPPPAS